MLKVTSYKNGLVRLLSAVEYDANCKATDKERLSSIRVSVKNYKREMKNFERRSKRIDKQIEIKIVKTIKDNKKVWNALQEHNMDTVGAKFQHDAYLDGIKDTLGETKMKELEDKAVDLLTEEQEGLA